MSEEGIDMMNEEMPNIIKQAYKAYPDYFQLRKLTINNLQMLFEYHTIDKRDKEIKSLRVKYDNSQSLFWSEKREEVSDYIYFKMKEKGLEKVFNRFQPYHSNMKYEDGECNKYGLVQKSDYDLSSIFFFAVPIGNISDSDGSNYYDSMDFRKLVEYLGDHKDILDIVIEYMVEYGKYKQFCAQLSCAFTTITTTNMLKNEIPEAYEYFYSKYGQEYEEQDAEEAKRKKKEKKAQCDKIEARRASLS